MRKQRHKEVKEFAWNHRAAGNRICDKSSNNFQNKSPSFPILPGRLQVKLIFKYSAGFHLWPNSVWALAETKQNKTQLWKWFQGHTANEQTLIEENIVVFVKDRESLWCLKQDLLSFSLVKQTPFELDTAKNTGLCFPSAPGGPSSQEGQDTSCSLPTTCCWSYVLSKGSWEVGTLFLSCFVLFAEPPFTEGTFYFGHSAVEDIRDQIVLSLAHGVVFHVETKQRWLGTAAPPSIEY